MRCLTGWALAAAMLLGTTSALTAADAKPKKSPEERFAKLDKNGDQKLSFEEYLGKRADDKKAAAEKRFAKMDKDGDKSLSLEEFKTPPKKKSN